MIRAAMADKTPLSVSTQERCTFCLQELNFMTDPRQLSCGHIFCLECLQSDYASEEKKCRVCRAPFDNDEISLLPKVLPGAVTEAEQDGDINNGHNKCDICKIDTPAVSFCKDCKRKICRNHYRHHAGYFEDSHEVMEISVYEMTDHCDQHGSEKISLGCGKCLTLACALCEPGYCGRRGVGHTFSTLTCFANLLREKHNKVLSACHEQIARLCQTEKDAWKKIDKFNLDCEEMVFKVKMTTNEQMAAIQESSDNLIEKINSYRESNEEYAEGYIGDLHTKIGNIEQLMSSLRRLTQSSIKDMGSHSQQKFVEGDKLLNSAANTESIDIEHTKVLEPIGKTARKIMDTRSVEYKLRDLCCYDPLSELMLKPPVRPFQFHKKPL